MGRHSTRRLSSTLSSTTPLLAGTYCAHAQRAVNTAISCAALLNGIRRHAVHAGPHVMHWITRSSPALILCRCSEKSTICYHRYNEDVTDGLTLAPPSPTSDVLIGDSPGRVFSPAAPTPGFMTSAFILPSLSRVWKACEGLAWCCDTSCILRCLLLGCVTRVCKHQVRKNAILVLSWLRH